LAIGIIPVRYGATRFPGKPLAPILGKPMVQWVYEGASRAARLERVIIATDDERIMAVAHGFGAEAEMTSAACASGTDRVAEVAARTEAVEAGAAMASLMICESDPALLADSNVVKVVTDRSGDALYFSRAPLRLDIHDNFYRHIGIYAFRRAVLLGFAGLPASSLEAAERLEQLRALTNGLRIRMVETSVATLSVDAPADIIKVENLLLRRNP
jgi:3-deoxy-manno-octulosonate cytidylyltransferase (CMP-KDO synthetase)